MNIVIIVGNYYPYYSAVGKCVGNVTDQLEKDYRVTVISQKEYIEQKDIEIFNYQKIIRIDTKENKIRSMLSKKIKINTGIKKLLFKNLLNIYKVIQITNLIFAKQTIKKDLVDAYYSALKNIKEPIDLIIPSSMPYESVLAAIKFKDKINNKVKILPYIFDQFSNSSTLHRFKWNRKLKMRAHLRLESVMLEKSISILMMKHLLEYFKHHFPNYIEKFNSIEHPLLVKPPISSEKDSFAKINVVYTGSFYKKLRNPEYFFNVIEKALGQLDAIFNIYSFGDCSDIVDRYSNQYPYRILNHGKVTTEKAYESMRNSNILVAIGNSDNSQVSSKIFEYFSFGKPIIYFYSNKDDYALKILKNYPLSLCLEQDYNKLEENVELFKEFCYLNSSSHIDFEEVKEIFTDATPEYTVNIINRLLGIEKNN